MGHSPRVIGHMLDVADSIGMPSSLSAEEKLVLLTHLEELTGSRITWSRILKARDEEHPEKRLPYQNLEDIVSMIRWNAGQMLGAQPENETFWREHMPHAHTMPPFSLQERMENVPAHKPKRYQRYIAAWAAKRTGNCLVVLPTGYGKTLGAAMIIEQSPLIRDQNGVVLMTAPTKELVEQHKESFELGKYGAFVKQLMVERRMHIRTPEKMLKQLDDHCLPEDAVLLFLDEGDIGIKANTGKYATFQITEQLGLLHKPENRRLIAMTATGFESQYESYAMLLDINPDTHILDKRNPSFATMILRNERKKLRRIRHCSPTSNHTYVVDLMRKKLLDVVRPLQEAFVHSQPERQGFPRFPIPKEGKEDVVPSVTQKIILDLKSRLEKMLDDTFGEIDSRKQVSLRGLWHRHQWDPERTTEEIELYRRQLSIYASLIDLFHVTECGNYAQLIERMCDISDRTLTTQARLMTEGKKPTTNEALEKFIHRFNRIPTPLQGKVRSLHALFTRLRLAEDIGDNERATQTQQDIMDALQELAKKAPETPPEVWEYTILYDKYLRKAVESLPQRHPKEKTLLELLQRQTKNPDERVLVKVLHRSTLYRLTALAQQEGYKADYLVGGASKKTALHNKLARSRFEHGDVNVLFGTSVINRGMDLRGANSLIIYDLSFGDPELTQILGRVGRTDDMFAKVYALLYNGGGSRDQILIQLFDENYHRLLAELGPSSEMFEGSA